MTGALGMLAGTYVAAASSKLLGGGLNWTTSAAIQLMLLSHAEVDGGPWSSAIPNWAAHRAQVCMALQVTTLIIQLGAVMLILGPWTRYLWAALLVAFHVGVYLTSHILFLAPMIFAAAVAIPWSWLPPQPAAVPGDPGELQQEVVRPADRPVLLALLLLAVVGFMHIASGG